jgi:hypothetical protein
MHDPYEMAMASLVRAAWDDLAGFLGEPSLNPVTQEEQEAAAMVIRHELAQLDSELAHTSLDGIIAAAKGEAFDAYWNGIADNVVETPEARISLLAFMESICGRPIALDRT